MTRGVQVIGNVNLLLLLFLLMMLIFLLFGFFSGAQFSREAGVLHEVMEMCQKQDAVVGEMRDIDVELSQMYKSLIEIVARMSGLQRRRVQVCLQC